MAQEQINVGGAANDGNGDALRDAFIKANLNFTDSETRFGALEDPLLLTIPILSKDDLPAPSAGVITLSTTDVKYEIYGSINLGTDRINVTAASVQIEGQTPASGFFYTGTAALISTTQTLQLFNLNLIGTTASVILDAIDAGTNTILCRSLGFVGGSSTDLVCVEDYANVLFDLCGFVSGGRGICLESNITNFTVILCQFQIGVVGINIDFGSCLCAAIAIETCVSKLASTSTFISAMTDNGNITATGGGTITHNKIDDSAIGSTISSGLSALDLRWTMLGNNNLVASDRLNPSGWAFYQDGDTVTQTAPAGEGNAIKFSVDGLGVNTTSDFEPRVIRGISELWDTTTDKMIPITEGDSFNTRISFTLTGKSGNPDILTIVFDIGSTSAITIPVYTTSIATPNAFPRTITLSAPVFALSTFLANGGQLFMYTDSGDIDIEARSILIERVSSGAS